MIRFSVARNRLPEQIKTALKKPPQTLPCHSLAASMTHPPLSAAKAFRVGVEEKLGIKDEQINFYTDLFFSAVRVTPFWFCCCHFFDIIAGRPVGREPSLSGSKTTPETPDDGIFLHRKGSYRHKRNISYEKKKREET